MPRVGALKPSSQSSVATHTPTSLNCHTRFNRQRGRARASSGTNQIEYCGLQTFVVSRKASTVRNANWPSRGLTGASSASQLTAPRAPSSRNATATPDGDQAAA